VTAPPVGDVLTYEQKVITVRRISAALGAFALLASLAACGDSDAAGGLDAVSVSGEFGAEPVVTWNGQVTTDTMAVTTLIEGTGDALATGDTAKVNLWIGNGYTKQQAYSTWDPEEGEKEPRGEQTLQLSDQMLKGILDGIVGHTVGSRVLVVAPPDDGGFGDAGSPSLGIGDGDHVVFVIDIDSKLGAKDVDPSSVPTIKFKSGKPVGFDFSNVSENPPTELQRATVKEGAGAVVESGQTVKVNYLGSVYGSSKVFDESFSKEPFETAIGQGSVIQGWDLGVVGATVGSRLVLVIPSDMAYGAGGSGDSIPPDSTLVFVVDIISAS